MDEQLSRLAADDPAKLLRLNQRMPGRRRGAAAAAAGLASFISWRWRHQHRLCRVFTAGSRHGAAR